MNNKKLKLPGSPGGKADAGFTMIELMVGSLIAIVMMMMVTAIYSHTVWRQRDLAGGSDAQKTASVTLLQMSNSLKQAGNMLGPSPEVWGCKLEASKGGATVLPLAGILAAPFDSLPQTLRLVPAIIKAGVVGSDKRESDIILTMLSDTGAIGLPLKLLAKPNGRALAFTNSNGLLANDLLLAVQNDNGVCSITQVDAGYTLSYSGGKLNETPKQVMAGGDYAGLAALSTLKANDAIYGLGALPRFSALGVNAASGTLESYDLLQMHGINKPTPIAENVFLIKALYGIDTDGDGGVDRWGSPRDAGWQFNDLHANTNAARGKLAKIKAIRVVLVTRGSYRGVEPHARTLELFTTVSGQQQTLKLSDAERRYRYQTYETVIPLLNVKTLGKN